MYRLTKFFYNVTKYMRQSTSNNVNVVEETVEYFFFIYSKYFRFLLFYINYVFDSSKVRKRD